MGVVRIFFNGYTLKQWKRPPRELDASVCGRIPIRTNRDDRYLVEDFQALPKAGYHKMFQRMLAASPGVRLVLRRSQVLRVRALLLGPMRRAISLLMPLKVKRARARGRPQALAKSTS